MNYTSHGVSSGKYSKRTVIQDVVSSNEFRPLDGLPQSDAGDSESENCTPSMIEFEQNLLIDDQMDSETEDYRVETYKTEIEMRKVDGLENSGHSSRRNEVSIDPDEEVPFRKV